MYSFELFSGFGGFEEPDTSQGYINHASPRDTGGPVVKTGPTAGQNRSRNQDGQWRRKRSDAGKPRV